MTIRNKYIIDRTLHWLSAMFLLLMLLNMSAVLHTVDWTIMGQIEHRQDAISNHVTLGCVLTLLLIARIAWSTLHRHVLPRTEYKSQKHKAFVNFTHLLMYLVPVLMMGLGLIMLNNNEISVNVLGIEFAANPKDYFSSYANARDWHILASSVLWWLIAIHVAGIMIAKR